jgi:type IV secretory pathway component VirB8
MPKHDPEIQVIFAVFFGFGALALILGGLFLVRQKQKDAFLIDCMRTGQSAEICYKRDLQQK